MHIAVAGTSACMVMLIGLSNTVHNHQVTSAGQPGPRVRCTSYAVSGLTCNIGCSDEGEKHATDTKPYTVPFLLCHCCWQSRSLPTLPLAMYDDPMTRQHADCVVQHWYPLIASDVHFIAWAGSEGPPRAAFCLGSSEQEAASEGPAQPAQALQCTCDATSGYQRCTTQSACCVVIGLSYIRQG